MQMKPTDVITLTEIRRGELKAHIRRLVLEGGYIMVETGGVPLFAMIGVEELKVLLAKSARADGL